MTTPNVAGIVLAAGAARRLGMAKQVLRDEHGVTLVERSVHNLLAAHCSPIIVVTGAWHEDVAATLALADVMLVHNAAWEEGLSSSIRAGVQAVSDALKAEGPEAVILVACDMPSVNAAHLRQLIECSDHGRHRVASEYVSPADEADPARQIRGIPALFPRADWAQLLALRGDRGARPLCAAPETRTVTLHNGQFDIDEPADLAEWRRSFPVATHAEEK